MNDGMLDALCDAACEGGHVTFGVIGAEGGCATTGDITPIGGQDAWDGGQVPPRDAAGALCPAFACACAGGHCAPCVIAGKAPVIVDVGETLGFALGFALGIALGFALGLSGPPGAPALRDGCVPACVFGANQSGMPSGPTDTADTADTADAAVDGNGTPVLGGSATARNEAAGAALTGNGTPDVVTPLEGAAPGS